MKKIKKIVFYAYRENKGATGGPGGVLYLQNMILGTNYKNVELQYKFKQNNKILRKIRGLYLGAFVQVIMNELFAFGCYYICNDIGTAYALSCLHKKYSLIYHQQGTIIEELTNFGRKLKKKEIKMLEYIEKEAFTKAKSVHFPSNGAKDMYFSSTYCKVDLNKVIVGKKLPNTIDAEVDDSVSSQEDYIIQGIKSEDNILTFLSVGTITSAKGQDQTVDFLKSFAKKYKGNIRYILVGDGKLRKEVLDKLNNVQYKQNNFDYYYFRNLDHSDVMKLHKIADIYIMLHRISIFDLATLEAMNKGTAIVLSDVGGNREFNCENNVFLVKNNDYDKTINNIIKSNINFYKNKNKEVFRKYFSKSKFASNYKELLDIIISN